MGRPQLPKVSFKTHPPQTSTRANRGHNFVSRPAATVRIQFLLGAKVSSIHFYCFMIKLIACHSPVVHLASDILELSRLCCKSAVPTSPCLWGVKNNILQLFALEMSAGTVVVPIQPGSDGDATHRPDRSTHTLVDPPTLYLEKIASLWMESRGEVLPGKLYHIYIPFSFQCYFRRQGSIHLIVADFIFDPPTPQFLGPLTTYRRKIYA